jgi:hypothetical protein
MRLSFLPSLYVCMGNYLLYCIRFSGKMNISELGYDRSTALFLQGAGAQESTIVELHALSPIRSQEDYRRGLQRKAEIEFDTRFLLVMSDSAFGHCQPNIYLALALGDRIRDPISSIDKRSSSLRSFDKQSSI